MKKQQIRQEKRKVNDDSEIDVPRKRCEHDTDTLPKSHQKDLKKTKGGTRFDGILEENHHLNTFLKGKAPLRSFSGFYWHFYSRGPGLRKIDFRKKKDRPFP